MGVYKKNVSYDKDAIFDSLDGQSLAEYLDIPMKRNGSTIFIECPNPDHYEKTAHNPKHCKLFENGCHCFSCGKTYNLYGMAYNWCVKSGMNVSGAEVYGICADAAGGREFFITSGKYKPQEKFPLSDKMLNLLGFDKYSHRVMVYQSVYAEGNEVVRCEQKSETCPSIVSLWREDKDAFWYIVNTKARQMKDLYHKLHEQFVGCKTEMGQSLASIYKRNEYDVMEFLLELSEMS